MPKQLSTMTKNWKTLKESKLSREAQSRVSQPLGAAYAFMGLESCMPVMHGSQGCTSFGIVLLVRENHPDSLIARGVPEEFVRLATDKLAAINGAYEKIEAERAGP